MFSKNLNFVKNLNYDFGKKYLFYFCQGDKNFLKKYIHPESNRGPTAC